MNPQFEQKVNESLETATYNTNVVIQPSPQSKINRNFNRKMILIFVGAIICFASLIIIRGILLQNPASFDNNSIIGQILNPNGVTGLDGLDITEAQSIINDFTASLKDEYQQLPASDARSLLLKTSTSSSIGTLKNDGTFIKNSEISNLIEIYRYYNDETFLYGINTPNVSLSELYLNTKDNKPILIKRLSKDHSFIDAHFSIQDKTFYYSFYDQNNTIFIEATDLKGTQYQLYQTNFLSTKTEIWNVNTSSGFIYLNQQRECFILQLRDKILNEYPCEKIKTNNGDNFYWSNENPNGQYASFEKGELYKFTLGELERKVLTSKNNGQVVQKLWLNGDRLYYIIDDLVQENSRLWNIQPKDIQYVNVMNAEEGNLSIKNMRSDIYAIIPMDSLYIISEEFFGLSTLYKYNPNPVFSVPVSFPNSFPVSFAEPKKLEDYYWEKVDFGTTYDTIEVIQPQYTFDF